MVLKGGYKTYRSYVCQQLATLPLQFNYNILCGLTGTGKTYTFLLQHNILGQVEGEGWIGPDTIVQRYWVLGDRQRRSGFETLHRVSNNTYHLTSGIMAGHFLTSTMEANVERQVS